MAIKKYIALIVFVALILTGSMINVYDVSASDISLAQDGETEADSEDREETTEQEETAEQEKTTEQEEFENVENTVGNQAVIKKAYPIGIGFSDLYTNDFFRYVPAKKLTGGSCYEVDEDIISQMVSYDYDDKGRLIKTTRHLNYVEEYEYNDNGDLKTVYSYAKDKLLEKTEFEYGYDAYGRCESEETYVTYYSGDVSDNGNDNKRFIGVSFYTYDDSGRRILENDRSTMNNVYYEYDANGNCIKKTVTNEGGVTLRTEEYDSNAFLIKETDYNTEGEVISNISYDYDYEYYSDGDYLRIKQEIHNLSDAEESISTKIYEFDYELPVSTTGIYCASNYPSIQAGINIQKSNPSDVVEYRWVGCNNNDPEHWFEVSPWTKDNNWMDWTPQESGGYVFVCYARIVGSPETEIQYAFGTEYHKQIKGICQIPYTGEGGGYLIGIESYDNPNHAYQYEMLILDCNLYMQGKDAWVYTTGRCGADGNCLWTVWQPQYGYYWTLFRIYDSSTGELIDEACYGFENVN